MTVPYGEILVGYPAFNAFFCIIFAFGSVVFGVGMVIKLISRS